MWRKENPCSNARTSNQLDPHMTPGQNQTQANGYESSEPGYETSMGTKRLVSKISRFRTYGCFVPRQFVPRLRRFVPNFDQFVPNKNMSHKVFEVSLARARYMCIGVSRVKNSSTSVKKLFCAMAACIN